MVIPKGWSSGTWESVLDGFVSGATPYRGTPSYYKGDIPWVSSGELNYNAITDTVEHITDEAVRDTNLSLHEPGTFLMAITGLEAEGTRGSCAILGVQATTNQSCMAIYPTNKMSVEYLFHYYCCYGDRLALEYCQGTKQQSYTAKIIRKLPIVYPEALSEQRAIATALSEVDDYICALEQLIAKKRNTMKGTMQELLTGKRRLSGFGGEWVEKTIGDCLTDIIGGGTPSRANPDFWDGGIPWATVKDFSTFNSRSTQEYISDAGLRNSATHVISRGTPITATRMGLGQIVVYDVDVTINQDLKGLVLNTSTNVGFFVFWFRSKKAEFEALGTGSTVKGITVEQVRGFPIRLPPTTAEQTAIAIVLSDMDAEIEALTARLNKVQNIKRGMMQDLLTGRTRLVNGETKEEAIPEDTPGTYSRFRRRYKAVDSYE